jgi:hypothetical protein
MLILSRCLLLSKTLFNYFTLFIFVIMNENCQVQRQKNKDMTKFKLSICWQKYTKYIILSRCNTTDLAKVTCDFACVYWTCTQKLDLEVDLYGKVDKLFVCTFSNVRFKYTKNVGEAKCCCSYHDCKNCYSTNEYLLQMLTWHCYCVTAIVGGQSVIQLSARRGVIV